MGWCSLAVFAVQGYVGSHKANGRPLGRPANAELRNARQHVHKVMDPIWQKAPDAQEYAGSDQDDKARKIIRMAARGRVYKWLAYKMGLDKYHTAELNIEQCREAYRLCRAVKYPEIRDWYKKEITGVLPV